MISRFLLVMIINLLAGDTGAVSALQKSETPLLVTRMTTVTRTYQLGSNGTENNLISLDTSDMWLAPDAIYISSSKALMVMDDLKGILSMVDHEKQQVVVMPLDSFLTMADLAFQVIRPVVRMFKDQDIFSKLNLDTLQPMERSSIEMLIELSKVPEDSLSAAFGKLFDVKGFRMDSTGRFDTINGFPALQYLTSANILGQLSETESWITNHPDVDQARMKKLSKALVASMPGGLKLMEKYDAIQGVNVRTVTTIKLGTIPMRTEVDVIAITKGALHKAPFEIPADFVRLDIMKQLRGLPAVMDSVNNEMNKAKVDSLHMNHDR